jgi:hypothetical protein
LGATGAAGATRRGSTTSAAGAAAGAGGGGATTVGGGATGVVATLPVPPGDRRKNQPAAAAIATATAAIAIALPADPGRAVHDAYDDGRVAERILVGATMLDIGAGISWIRADVRPAIAELLELPADWMVRTIVQLGHPTAAARRPKTAPGEARLPRAEVVFRERWPDG